MVDVVLFGERLGGGDEGFPVVRDEFDDGSPTREDVFEDELGEGFSIVGRERAVFGIGGEGASGLHDVSVATVRGHEHDVDVNFAKERGGRGRDWGSLEFGELSGLTLMACLDVPPNVPMHSWPPKTILYACPNCEESFVTEFVMH